MPWILLISARWLFASLVLAGLYLVLGFVIPALTGLSAQTGCLLPTLNPIGSWHCGVYLGLGPPASLQVDLCVVSNIEIHIPFWPQWILSPCSFLKTFLQLHVFLASVSCVDSSDQFITRSRSGWLIILPLPLRWPRGVCFVLNVCSSEWVPFLQMMHASPCLAAASQCQSSLTAKCLYNCHSLVQGCQSDFPDSHCI